MYKKNYIVGIIPARGGSKGIKNKNIKLLLGKPLIAYTIEAALESRVFDRVIVSTDSLKIKRVAQRYGAQAPFLRPKHLAKDNAPTIPALRHAIRFLEQKTGFRPDLIVILQPTSPLRKPEHIKEALDKFLSTKSDSVVSVCEERYSPYSMAKLVKNKVQPFLKESSRYTRRQDLPVVYRFNGAVYVTRTDIIMKRDDIVTKNTAAIIMGYEESVDIDTGLDFQLAELLLKKRLYKNRTRR